MLYPFVSVVELRQHVCCVDYTHVANPTRIILFACSPRNFTQNFTQLRYGYVSYFLATTTASSSTSTSSSCNNNNNNNIPVITGSAAGGLVLLLVITIGFALCKWKKPEPTTYDSIQIGPGRLSTCNSSELPSDLPSEFPNGARPNTQD